MQRRPSRTIAACALALLAACGSREAAEPFPKPVVVEIERGASSDQIAEILESQGVIESKWAFLWERIWNRETTLMAGEYLFRGPVEASEAFKLLAEGRVRLYPITIPEGLNRFEIAVLVAESGLVSGEDFLDLTADPAPVKDLLTEAETLEGCLFPETYNLARTSTANDLVDAMIAQFREALQEAHSQRTEEIDLWKGVVLASMIEKETGLEAERGLVSSVFHNRMRLGMLMQCDPTIIYGLVLEDRYRGRIYTSDLSDPHPYNTYVHGGLPPGPIANPGRESIQAAFAPSASDFLYFVAKPGDRAGHVFSKTLRSHNRAVREWRRYRRSMR